MQKIKSFFIFENQDSSLDVKEIRAIINSIKKFNKTIPKNGIEAVATGSTVDGNFYTVYPIEYNTEQAIFKIKENGKVTEDIKPFTFLFKDDILDQIKMFGKEIKAYGKYNK